MPQHQLSDCLQGFPDEWVPWRVDQKPAQRPSLTRDLLRLLLHATKLTMHVDIGLHRADSRSIYNICHRNAPLVKVLGATHATDHRCVGPNTFSERVQRLDIRVNVDAAVVPHHDESPYVCLARFWNQHLPRVAGLFSRQRLTSLSEGSCTQERQFIFNRHAVQQTLRFSHALENMPWSLLTECGHVGKENEQQVQSVAVSRPRHAHSR